MKVPALRTCSVDEMGEVAYRKYLNALGNLTHHARRRFLAELPEVASRDLARRWGFESVHVYAAKVAGMRRGLVNEILSLHEALGEFEELWAQLRSGAVGWSKLKAIKKVVTRETASWWAAKVAGCSLRQLEEEVGWLTGRGSKGAVPRVGERGGEGERTSVRRAPGQAHRRQDGEAGLAVGGLLEAGAGDRPEAVALQDLGCEGARDEADTEADFETDTEADFDADFDAGYDADSDALADVEAHPRRGQRPRPRLVIYPSDAEMAMLEALRDQVARRTGLATSLNEVVRQAIRQLVSGSVTGKEEAQTRGQGQSQGPGQGQAAHATRTPIPAMLVLYRNEDTGEIRIPTRRGLVPAELDASSPVLTSAKEVRLSDLVDQAASTPVTAASRYVPVAHQRLVAARYGNRCGFPGCLERAEDLHHSKEAVSEGGTSHADNLVPLCALHHDAAHSGWLRDSTASPRDWEFRGPGEAAGPRPVDDAYLAHRAAATAGRRVPREAATAGRKVPREAASAGRRVPREAAAAGRRAPGEVAAAVPIAPEEAAAAVPRAPE